MPTKRRVIESRALGLIQMSPPYTPPYYSGTLSLKNVTSPVYPSKPRILSDSRNGFPSQRLVAT